MFYRCPTSPSVLSRTATLSRLGSLESFDSTQQRHRTPPVYSAHLCQHFDDFKNLSSFSSWRSATLAIPFRIHRCLPKLPRQGSVVPRKVSSLVAVNSTTSVSLLCIVQHPSSHTIFEEEQGHDRKTSSNSSVVNPELNLFNND